MSTRTGSLLVRAVMGWALEKDQAPWADTIQKPTSHAFRVAPTAATWTEVFLGSYTMLASGTQVVDFRSFTNLLGTAITATGILGMMIKAAATVTGGVLQIETDATNGLVWPITAGTTPSISLPVGTDGACLLVQQGTAFTVDATHRRLLLTNTGTQTITATLSALIKTA